LPEGNNILCWKKKRKSEKVYFSIEIISFLFWGSAPCCVYFIKVFGRTVPRYSCLKSLFIYISPLHVSAIAGHLQAEYTINSVAFVHERTIPTQQPPLVNEVSANFCE
jgi:hypothetical protein